MIHADETTLQVLREPGRAAQSKSYEWIYRTSGCAKHKIVIYDYRQTREQEHPQEFLKDFKGFLHTDGYQAYHNLPAEIVVVGCWAHVRRKWEHLYKTIPKEKRKDSSAVPGTATGTVRLAKTPARDAGSERNIILVIRSASDDFLPLFKHAAALIVEDDDHEGRAVTAGKTLGIPVITGAYGAMGALKNGACVTVDAGKGVVCYEGLE